MGRSKADQQGEEEPTLPPEEAEDTDFDDPLIGRQLGQYVVTRKIGLGSLGVVYEATQPVISRRVAIKVLRRDLPLDPLPVEQLLSEARTVNAIRHRGIIDIFGFGQTPDGRPYFVMEYLEGRPLDQVVTERAPMPPDEVVDILDEIFTALGAAHRVGVIHRDVKPSNVFVVSAPRGKAYVKLLDFGIALRADPKRPMNPQTLPSHLVGTPDYLAPEQALGEPLGPPADLYSAGAVAFNMLTGRPPFLGKDSFAVVQAHVNEKPVPPSSLVKTVPEAVDALVLRLLSKSPSDRPATAAEARAELRPLRRDFEESPTLLDSLS